MTERNSTQRPTQPRKRWFANRLLVILLLIFFFPLGLFLMWKYTSWTKVTKWIVTLVGTALTTLTLIGAYNSPPTITVSGEKNGTINVDTNKYTLTGDVSSMKTVTLFTINRTPVSVSDDASFAHIVSLEEGDNIYNLVATNDNGERKTTLIIHRTTQAEIEARARADKEKFERELQEQHAKTEEAEKEAIRKADEEAKAQKKAEKESKKAAKEEAKTNKEAAKEKDKSTSKSTSSCNFWCWLTGGNEETKAAKKAEEDAKQEAKRKADEEARQKAAYTIADDEVLYLEVYTESYVKQLLKSPSTAKFGGWQRGRIDASTVVLKGHVDSHNSFGAMLRSDFSMTWCKHNHKYSAIRFVFNGNLYADRQCGQ